MSETTLIINVGWERETVNRVRFDGTRVRIVLAGRDITNGELFDFLGKGQKEVTDPNSGQKGVAGFDFPIGNVKTWDEAFAAFDEAQALHWRVLQAQNQAQQEAMFRHQEQARREQVLQQALRRRGIVGVDGR